MKDTGRRFRSIPKEEKYDNISEFTGEDWFNKKLDWYILKLYNQLPPRLSFIEFKENLENQKKALATLLSEEARKIIAQLKIENEAEKIKIDFAHVEGKGAHVYKFGGFFCIDLSEDWILGIFTRNSQKNKAILTSTLAHEFYHIYAKKYYPEADKKTTENNKDMNSEEYQKDRIEIAASLYELQYLIQRSEETRESNPEYSEALSKWAEIQRYVLTERTSHLAPGVIPNSN